MTHDIPSTSTTRGAHGAPGAAGIVPELLTTRQAAELLGLGERTLWRHSRCGICPQPVQIGGNVRYRRDELMEWIRAGCPRTDGRATR